MPVIEADLTWTGRAFERGVRVRVEKGRIAGFDGETDERLTNRALLPGFVNAHSHAFQRGLRGRGESFTHGRGSFWSWREAMYALVGVLDADHMRALCTQAFREMRRAGITTVGEFHYLHHEGSGEDYALDDALLAAAADAGIRVVLLQAFYNTGAIHQPLAGAQRRFRSADPDSYWRQMDRLTERLDPATQALGAVVHSIRAARREHLASIAAEAKARGMVLHMHVEEQRQEIEQCLDVYRKRPMQVLLDAVEVNARFTAVHCTHTDAADMALFREAGGRVCLCPLTEANLGDGIADVPGIGGGICLGTDSNARISMLEEARWFEYAQRLAREERGIVGGGRALLEAATAAGARSLGIPAGRIAEGLLADFVAVDLEAPTLAGWTEETLLDMLICGAAEEAIAATCVGGKW